MITTMYILLGLIGVICFVFLIVLLFFALMLLDEVFSDFKDYFFGNRKMGGFLDDEPSRFKCLKMKIFNFKNKSKTKED